VVCSHLHPDHCGCNAFFKRATVMVHANDVAAAREPDAEAMGYIAAEWDFGPIERLDGQRDLFGDSRIVLIPLPGHTPGSTGALVQLERNRFLLAADAVPLRITLDTGIMPRNMRNPDDALNSLAEIRAIEARGVTVLCGHDAAQWETLRKGADFYD
jgi:glyoxylase-like metal-dependent hydrolase (beta-lactamase superfamily II)